MIGIIGAMKIETAELFSAMTETKSRGAPGKEIQIGKAGRN